MFLDVLEIAKLTYRFQVGKVDRYLSIRATVDVFLTPLINTRVLCSVEVNNLSVMLYFTKFPSIVSFTELVEEASLLIYLSHKNNHL